MPKRNTPKQIEEEISTDVSRLVYIVDPTFLVEKLKFTDEGVVEAALEGASLFEAAARYRVGKMRSKASAEMNLDRIKADTELAIRKEAAAEGEKITEGNIKAKLAVDDDVAEAQRRYNEAEADEEYSRLLVEAYRIRRDSLKAIVELTGAERAMGKIVESNQASLEETRKKLANKYPGRQ